MAKRGKGNIKKLPLCGDNLTDLLFRIIIDTICYKIAAIKKKKNLTDPNEKDRREKRVALYGLYESNTKEVYLSSSKCRHPTKMSMIPALIHEILHEVMPDVFHHRIYRLERVLKTRFTDEQKRYLRKFIPQHDVKAGPRPSE